MPVSCRFRWLGTSGGRIVVGFRSALLVYSMLVGPAGIFCSEVAVGCVRRFVLGCEFCPWGSRGSFLLEGV